MLALILAASQAYGVSPIKVESTDTRDLESIRKAIGSARVVHLGELTHGDGTSFQIKSRLVKYLHEKAGFDVLVWEAGMIECDSLNVSLKGEYPIEEVAAAAVFPHWSHSQESIGVFEYARRTHKTRRPLLMAGYDIQSSGSGGNRHFLDLASSVSKVARSDAFQAKLDRVDQMSAGMAKDDAILALAIPLRGVFQMNLKQIQITQGKSGTSELQQQIQSFCSYYLMMESYRRFQRVQTGEEFQVGYNIRERANYKNMHWLMNEKYKGKKLIVWAHNSHVSNLGSDGAYRRPARGEVMLDSTGRHLKAELGSDLYSIGFLASSGQWSWLGQPPNRFEPAPAGSIEELISQSGHDHAFLDLRRSNALPGPMPGYLNRQNGQLATLDWPKVFDGVIYVREMKPRTQIKSPGK